MESSNSAYPVHLGFWVNKAHGPVLGSTLTLTRSDGAFLIAFIAFFVTIVGTQTWRILCFFIFRFFSDATFQDALYHQRQAVLRNSASPFGGTRTLIQMLHAWAASNPKARPYKRILPLLIGTILVAIALVVVSGLSSQIAQGNEVLIDSSDCGIIRARNFVDDPAKLQTLWSPYITRLFERSSEYAQRCYRSEDTSDSCGTFIREALPMTITRNASCPFDESLCRSQDSNLILDTGLIDSQTDLGLNRPGGDRFQIRHRLHCAPLATSEFRSEYVYNNKTFTTYQYGDASQGTDCNCTASIDEKRVQERFNYSSPAIQAPIDYSLTSYYTSFSGGSLVDPEPVYAPIPELSRHSGDLYLTFLFPGEVMFTEPSEDDWYRATTPIEVRSSNNLGTYTYEMYMADEPAWPMACAEQWEACRNGICSGLGSDTDTGEVVNNTLHMGSGFLGEGSYLRYMGPISNIIKLLGKTSLASRYKSGNVMSSRMSANEWHLDVIHWVSVMLASLQYQLAEIASGPVYEDPEIEEFITRPNERERAQYCGSQIIRSTAYTSFSVFGLFFIAVTGILIIIISATIEQLAALIKSTSGRYTRLEWRANQSLHLQRLAHNDTSQAEWVVGAWDVPVVTNDSRLLSFQDTEPKDLPQLQRHTRYSPGENDFVHGKDDSEIVIQNVSPEIGFEERQAATESTVYQPGVEPPTTENETHTPIPSTNAEFDRPGSHDRGRDM